MVAQTVKNLPAMQETCVQSLGWKDLPEKKMATHSSILAWRIPWTEVSNSPSNEYSGLISFRIDWFDFLAVQEAREAGEKWDLLNLSAECLQSATPSETAP